MYDFDSPADDPTHAVDRDLAGPTETGTTVVALRTEGSAVVAADRRASLGGRFVTNKTARKIEPVHPTAAVGISGTVGGMQDFLRRLRAEASLYEVRRGGPARMDALSTLAGNLLRGGPYVSMPVLAGVDAGGPRVFDLDAAGGVSEADYVATGSGMQLAFGVLEREYDLSVGADEARGLAARAVGSASARDTASGDGLLLATITDEDVALETYEDAAEVA